MPETELKETRLENWRRRTFVPLLAASLVFFAAYAWPIIDPGLSDAWRAAWSSPSGPCGPCSPPTTSPA